MIAHLLRGNDCATTLIYTRWLVYVRSSVLAARKSFRGQTSLPWGHAVKTWHTTAALADSHQWLHFRRGTPARHKAAEPESWSWNKWVSSSKQGVQRHQLSFTQPWRSFKCKEYGRVFTMSLTLTLARNLLIYEHSDTVVSSLPPTPPARGPLMLEQVNVRPQMELVVQESSWYRLPVQIGTSQIPSQLKSAVWTCGQYPMLRYQKNLTIEAKSVVCASRQLKLRTGRYLYLCTNWRQTDAHMHSARWLLWMVPFSSSMSSQS